MWLSAIVKSMIGFNLNKYMQVLNVQLMIQYFCISVQSKRIKPPRYNQAAKIIR